MKLAIRSEVKIAVGIQTHIETVFNSEGGGGEGGEGKGGGEEGGGGGEECVVMCLR